MSAFTQLIDQGGSFLRGQAGRTVTLQDPTGDLILEVSALVSELRTVRFQDDSQNWRRLWVGHVAINKAAEPALAQALSELGSPVVPDNWRVTMGGKTYKTTNPSEDQTTWEFDIKEVI